MNPKKTYVILIGTFVGSLLVIFAPVRDAIRTVAAVPAVVSLFGALFVLARDHIAFEHSQLLQQSQHSFAMGATSHMAAVAFDKHVSFCEEYVAEMQKVLIILFREGPTREAMANARTFYQIRAKWALWITPEIAQRLEKFERAITKIANNERLVSDYPGLDKRHELIDEMYKLMSDVIGEKVWDGKELSGELAVAAMIDKLRNALGISELTALRSELIRYAHSSMTTAVKT